MLRRCTPCTRPDRNIGQGQSVMLPCGLYCSTADIERDPNFWVPFPYSLACTNPSFPPQVAATLATSTEYCYHLQFSVPFKSYPIILGPFRRDKRAQAWKSEASIQESAPAYIQRGTKYNSLDTIPALPRSATISLPNQLWQEDNSSLGPFRPAFVSFFRILSLLVNGRHQHPLSSLAVGVHTPSLKGSLHLLLVYWFFCFVWRFVLPVIYPRLYEATPHHRRAIELRSWVSASLDLRQRRTTSQWAPKTSSNSFRWLRSSVMRARPCSGTPMMAKSTSDSTSTAVFPAKNWTIFAPDSDPSSSQLEIAYLALLSLLRPMHWQSLHSLRPSSSSLLPTGLLPWVGFGGSRPRWEGSTMITRRASRRCSTWVNSTRRSWGAVMSPEEIPAHSTRMSTTNPRQSRPSATPFRPSLARPRRHCPPLPVTFREGRHNLKKSFVPGRRPSRRGWSLPRESQRRSSPMRSPISPQWLTPALTDEIPAETTPGAPIRMMPQSH